MQNVNEYDYQKVHDEKLMESVCVSALVRVIDFDPEKMTVDVQPLSKHLENGSYESQPPILNVPVACTRSGGFIFRPWINADDIGLIVYLDHDMDDILATGKEGEPSTERNHSTSDAAYIGAVVAGEYAVKDLPSRGIALAKEDGSIYVMVRESGISIKGDVEITGKLTVTETVTAKNI